MASKINSSSGRLSLDYANFEGTIPEGQHGAGAVEIWDRGKYVLKEKTDDDKLILEIKGNKLKGLYYLIRFKGKENWLFFKKKWLPHLFVV